MDIFAISISRVCMLTRDKKADVFWTTVYDNVPLLVSQKYSRPNNVVVTSVDDCHVMLSATC